jgi:hypothetical protein
MIVTHDRSNITHAYEIDHIEAADKKTRIILTADYGRHIKADTTQEFFSRWPTFHGANTFVIHATASSKMDRR